MACVTKTPEQAMFDDAKKGDTAVVHLKYIQHYWDRGTMVELQRKDKLSIHVFGDEIKEIIKRRFKVDNVVCYMDNKGYTPTQCIIQAVIGNEAWIRSTRNLDVNKIVRLDELIHWDIFSENCK